MSAPTGRGQRPEGAGAISSEHRYGSTRPFQNQARVKLFELHLRTSKNGNQYLSGLLGHATVLGWRKKIDELPPGADEVWELFVVERGPKR